MQWQWHSENLGDDVRSPMKDGGRMTFFPELISSGLLAGVKCTQLTNLMISGQEVTSRSAAGIGPGQFSYFSEFEDSEESLSGAFLH